MAKQVLGRGLGSLLGEMDVAYNMDLPENNDFLEIKLDEIELNPYQPRKTFDKVKLEELSESILKNGLLQPIVVSKNENGYLLIAGERRLRASKLSGLLTIKAVILDIDKTKLRELALIENIQRDDLNVIEIATSYKGLIDDYQITHEELAKKVSKSRSSISNIIRLLTLTKFTQNMIIDKKITLGHAKLLVSLDEDLQQTIVSTIINQNLSVRETEVLIKRLNNDTSEISNNKENKNRYDLSTLNNLKDVFDKNNLEIKVDNNYFKIKITSQDDIEQIANYFNNI